MNVNVLDKIDQLTLVVIESLPNNRIKSQSNDCYQLFNKQLCQLLTQSNFSNVNVNLLNGFNLLGIQNYVE